jgi:hypothetical protein
MASTLKVLGVGLTGVEPQLFFLNTDQILSVVTSAGYIQAVAAQEGLGLGTKFLVLASYNNGSGGSANDVFVPSFSGSVITLVPVAAIGGITGGESLGGTDAIYAGIDGTNLTFKGLTAGSNVTLTPSGTDITIAASAGITGGSNLGGDIGLYEGVSGSNLTFLGLTAGTNITLTPSGTDVTIDASGGSYTPHAYKNVYWVATNGSDSNLGTSIETPWLTLPHAYSIARITGGVINLMGQFSDASTISFNGEAVTIIGPAASLTGSYTGYVAYMQIGALSNWTDQGSGEIIAGSATNCNFSNNVDQTTYVSIQRGGGTITIGGAATFISLYIGTLYDQTHSPGTLALTTGATIYLNTDIQYPTGITNDGSAYLNDILGATIPKAVASSHVYQQSNWIDELNGNDSALGTSIETPLLTYQTSVTNASTVDTLIFGETLSPSASDITTLGTGQTLFIDSPGATFGTITIGTNDNLDARAYLINTIIAGGNAQIFNASEISNYTHNFGTSYVTSLRGSAVSVTGGVFFLTAQDSIAATCTGGVSYLSGLNNMAISASTDAFVFVMSPSAATIGHDGTAVVQGFAGSTIYGPAAQDNIGFITATVDTPVDFSTLGGGAEVNVIRAASALVNPQYKVTGIYLNFGGTNFSGGGDRDLALTDGTTQYTVIPAATLQALASVNAGWGSVSVPFPASAGINTLTVASANLYWQYANGTTDYTAGSVTLTVEYARVV